MMLNPVSQGTTDKIAIGLVVGVVLLVLYSLKKTLDAVKHPGALGAAVGAGAVDLAGGVILGIGDGLGVPRTDQSACDRAKAAGDTLGASFACPASDFVRYVFGSKPSASDQALSATAAAENQTASGNAFGATTNEWYVG